jgi:hypothetical protein
MRHRFHHSRLGVSLPHVCAGATAIVASGVVLGGAT